MSQPERRDDYLDRLNPLGDVAEGGTVSTALLERLQYVADAALAHLTVKDLLDELLSRVRDVLRADTAVALLVDPNEPVLVVMEAKGLEGEVERGARIPLGNGLAGRIAADQRAIVINDVDEAEKMMPLLLLRAKGVKSLLGAPLVVEGALIGLIEIGTLQPREFNDDDALLLRLVADRAALALDHARLFEAERRARLESDAAVRVRDEFLSIAAHELKTPLTTVKSAAQLLTRRLRHGGAQVDPDEMARLAATLEGQISRLELLVSDLLDTSRLEKGHVSIRPQPMDLSELAELVVTSMRFAPQYGPEHQLVLDAPEPVEGTWDPIRLERALTNLVTNALAFIPEGGEVRVGVRSVETGAEVVIAGQTNGKLPGDDPRVTRARTRQSLMAGLFITSQTIEQHSGQIMIAGDLDGSISYTLTLPPAPSPELLQ